ncbi:endonuclease/exonuclease/phosphatase family protein [Neptuniibacter sp. QD37_6]|uniref:endonuclease/exonuclease/phosphatase family protein n=1 Tax=Neptuniibacter sp. QD37_6 TaxID=3398210 RepID=UPI0039F58F1E
MKIVTWNCNGALRKKTDVIDTLKPDIAVVQECENPDESTAKYKAWAGEYLWFGRSKNKGIGIFAKNGNTVRKLEWSGEFRIDGLVSRHASLSWKTEELELFFPCRINDELNLLAVWTKAANSNNFGYMGQFWKYLQIHRLELSLSPTMIVGDFNSNTRWDQPDRWWNHSDVIDELREIGITSLYHEQFSEDQGKETSPTFYLHRKEDKPYHIDYVFLSEDLKAISKLTVGKRNDWISVSDHMPLIVETKY